jgi:hypothetical protein
MRQSEESLRLGAKKKTHFHFKSAKVIAINRTGLK